MSVKREIPTDHLIFDLPIDTRAPRGLVIATAAHRAGQVHGNHESAASATAAAATGPRRKVAAAATWLALLSECEISIEPSPFTGHCPWRGVSEPGNLTADNCLRTRQVIRRNSIITGAKRSD